MKTLRLDIDLISDELYSLLLKEFKEQNPDHANDNLTDWELTCNVNKN